MAVLEKILEKLCDWMLEMKPDVGTQSQIKDIFKAPQNASKRADNSTDITPAVPYLLNPEDDYKTIYEKEK